VVHRCSFPEKRCLRNGASVRSVPITFRAHGAAVMLVQSSAAILGLKLFPPRTATERKAITSRKSQVPPLIIVALDMPPYDITLESVPGDPALFILLEQP
jgi:hypothetical protein